MTLPTNTAHYGLLAAVVATIAITTTGCHVSQPDPPSPSTAATNALNELNCLPSLEDTTKQVQATVDQITTAASKTIPGIVWTTGSNEDTGNCEAPYEQTDGKRYFLPNSVAENVAVSEQQWTGLLQIAKDAAAKLGATDVQVMQDEPGKHDVWFTGPAGVFIKFSYKGNVVVSGYTGCRLPQNKK
ncbi:LppA family lipoprotein [Mycolicibacterium moriokaense]|uniref:Putative LppA-like lipoprotein n=1 Tax=Mycolicibacterium moriokaense TaxID=39691 RepID=A0A318HMS3_9MYCO|nr:LppA family lipoprotein [Mycolicibacterium moriokaense]PXX09260.1 putative LppA-like lipoprotein [Mycolicibacterium moriokaense]